MRFLDRLLGREDTTESDYDESVRTESAKVQAYRTANEVVEATKVLVAKAIELRAEIEAIDSE